MVDSAGQLEPEAENAAELYGRRRGAPTPVNRERPFGFDELFFSTTDKKGIILDGNGVFTRISGYARDELIGSPHNIIRHPEMPRCVFKLLWDEIGAGHTIAAYVKNMASDGAFYWVLATVVPIPGGYLSVRLKPSTPYFEAAKALYPELLALETAVEAGNVRNRKRAMEASSQRLLELLKSAGFASYTAFMHTALPAELKARDATFGISLRRRLAPSAAEAHPILHTLFEHCTAINDYLDGIVAKLDSYTALNDQLTQKARFVVDLADDVGIFSLNALLASTRMQQAGETLGAVAAIMRARSDAGNEVFTGLSAELSRAVDLLSGMVFPTATTKLQNELAMVFLRELLEGGASARAAAESLSVLAGCLAEGLDHLTASLSGLETQMQAVDSHVIRLRADLNIMRALEVNGRIEAARASASEAVTSLFSTIGEQVRRARQEISSLTDLRSVTFATDAGQAALMRGRVGDMQHRLRVLQAA